MVKTLHIITGLGQGGAERQLSNIVSTVPDQSAVFSIMPPGITAEEVRQMGVTVYSGDAKRAASVGWILKLRNAIKEFQPDVVMGWMYHGNLAASIARKIGFSGPVLWNVRHSLHDINKEKLSTRWVIRAGALLKSSPKKIIYNSAVSAAQHEQEGYPPEKRVVLPNGFDLERFKPNFKIRKTRRDELGIPRDHLLLGVVGRAHPMKNHLGWIQAFRELKGYGVQAHCVIMGSGVVEPAGSIAMAVRQAGLENSITLLQPTQSPEDLYPALDLLVMPSLWGEGFPNVVGEAMACGVPALVTDVGDAAAVVGNTGFVAEKAEPATLAHAVSSAVQLGSHGLSDRGRLARDRMAAHFSLPTVASTYQLLLHTVAQKSPRE